MHLRLRAHSKSPPLLLLQPAANGSTLAPKIAAPIFHHSTPSHSRRHEKDAYAIRYALLSKSSPPRDARRADGHLKLREIDTRSERLGGFESRSLRQVRTRRTVPNADFIVLAAGAVNAQAF